MKRFAVILLALSVFATVGYAQNGMAQVMGTVTAVTDSTITVKTMAGKSQTVLLTATTTYMRGKAVSKLEEVKIGNHIVVHASKKSTDLVAVEVKTGSMNVSAWASHMGGAMNDSPATTDPH